MPNNHYLTATQARAISKEARGEVDVHLHDMEMIFRLVEKAAKDGKTNLSIQLSDPTIALQLKALGYKCKQHDGDPIDSYLLVSW